MIYCLDDGNFTMWIWVCVDDFLVSEMNTVGARGEQSVMVKRAILGVIHKETKEFSFAHQTTRIPDQSFLRHVQQAKCSLHAEDDQQQEHHAFR